MAEQLNSLEELGSVAVEQAAPVHVQKIDAQGRAYATGKRKDAIARVWVKPVLARSQSTAKNSLRISHVRFCR